MLELKDVTKKYSFRPVVNKISFSVRSADIVGYLGPNGAGKTTTIKMLAGLLKPSSGKILFNGQDIKKSLKDYKKRLGYVPENSAVYLHLSARDYLFMVGRLRNISAKVLNIKITEIMRLLNLSLEIDMAMSSYSKGMVQKVLLASALLHNPDILLLDEPLSGLDVTPGLIMRDLIKTLANEGKIVVYSSHILEIVEKICSRAIIIHEGSIVADDSVENLRNLMKLPSLEQIFNQLVIQEDTQSIAKGITDVIKFKS